MIIWQRARCSKVGKIESSDDVQYDDLMSSVYIKTLIEGECDWIIVQCGVGRRVVLFDGCMR